MTNATEAFIQQTNLESVLLIGYYGGGNYGDELLLEVLANLLAARPADQLTITYQTPKTYKTFHHDMGFTLIPMASKKHLAKAILHHKNIIIGGGGLWGLDVNLNIFLLSAILFFARFCLRKNVYLLAVGYYDSTSTLGRISAWLAGKAATKIVARDEETFQNFQKISKHVALGSDLAWQIPKLETNAYESELQKLERILPIKQKTLFITLRRFKSHQKNRYTELIEACIAHNSDKQIIVSLLEPKSVDPAGYALVRSWQKKYSHVRITDFSYNPLALYLFFRKYHKKLALIGPQFHIIITAALCNVPFIPMAYDNKVTALLEQLGSTEIIPIQQLKQSRLQLFIDAHFPRRQKT